MDTVTVLGTYKEQEKKTSLSDSTLMLNASEMSANWRRVSLTADYLAKYYSYYFPYKEKALFTMSRNEAENTLSFVINELIENTAKYSNTPKKNVTIKLDFEEKHLIFHISNYVNQNTAQEFIKICKEIFEKNTEELYIKKLEENAETGKGGSGLGYLTLINDYNLELGFKFEKIKEQIIKVTVQAAMKYKEE
ncbi:MAG: hypothetical protein JW822_00285 [Spirochaetales bacterium]|nr:hypothetical protein [Spirochaetales bacterium]